MKLTIGMATIEDYDGVYFTIQALRLYHERNLADHEIEYIVVDNKPSGKSSQHVQNYLKHAQNARYIPMAEPEGTTQSRNRVFTEATGDAVLCIDSHILLYPGTIEKLINFYIANPDCNDLLTGPMMGDDLSTPNTHFDDVWRAEMWGIWGQAWGCAGTVKIPWSQENPAREYLTPAEFAEKAFIKPCPQNFSIIPWNGTNVPVLLGPNPQPISACPICHTSFPKELTPQGMKSAKFVDLAHTHDPFEIPGQGLGLFTCRKSAWLGFNEQFRGFGGEEMYIHEKYRQAGRKNLCLPWLKWGHRFGRPLGTPYVPTSWNKVRNYILGHLELGLSLDRLYEHFVTSGLFPKDQWEVIRTHPIESGKIKLTVQQGRPQPRASVQEPSELIAWVKENPRDLDQHVEKLFELSKECEHVTEFTHRRESTVGLLGAKKIVSYQAEQDGLLPRLTQLFPRLRIIPWNLGSSTDLPIDETDLLFLDTVGTANRLYSELTAYHKQVRRWIVMHDTQLFGEKGEDGGPGMLPALRKFMTENPKWSVVYHTSNQYGLTVISKLPCDKPKLPGVIEMAANFSQAMATYVADGMKNIPKEDLTARLEICTMCDQRNGNSCAVCGCNLAAKASMRAMECPIGRWPQLSTQTA